MFRGGPQLTGVFAGAPPRRLTGVRFRVETGAPLRNAPVASDGVLYFGAADGAFRAIDAHTGAIAWNVNIGTPVTSSPALVGNAVVFTARDEGLYALSRRDGRRLWRTSLGPALGPQNYWDFYTSSPVLFDDKLYVGGGDGAVYAINPRSGRMLWRADLGSRIRATPAVSDDLIVIGTQSGHVYGLDRATGAQRWRFATDGAGYDFARRHNDTTSIFESPTISGHMVAVGGRDGQLYGLDLASGEQRWKITQDGGSWILSTGAADGVFYIGGGSASLVQAVNVETGEEIWRFSTESAVFGSPTLVGDVLLLSDFSGYLYAINRTTGAQLWRFAMPDRSFSTPAVADGIVYASSDDGVLYALDTVTEVAPPRAIQHLVYRGGRADEATPGWFALGFDSAILGAFVEHGYQALSDLQLQKAMNDQIESGQRSVIVFADNRVPASVMESDTETALIRRYVEAGGSLVFLSSNPVNIVYAADGSVRNVDESIAERVLGLHYPARTIDYGYHTSRLTAVGARWGLRDNFVVNGVIGDDQVTTVLARDEYGMATSWVRNYGGAHQGMVLQLSVPGNRIADLTPSLNAVEFALAERGN